MLHNANKYCKHPPQKASFENILAAKHISAIFCSLLSMLYSISQFVLIHAIRLYSITVTLHFEFVFENSPTCLVSWYIPFQLCHRLEMKPEKRSAGKNIVGGVKKVSSLAAKKQRPLRFKEGRRGQSSSSSDDEVLENKVLFLF